MTRNTDSSYREQGRAVFLAAIMIVSVVGMSVAFTGAATAEAPEVTEAGTSTSGDNIGGIPANVVFQGDNVNITNATQTTDEPLRIDGEDVGPDDPNNNTVYVVEVTDRSNGDITGAQTVLDADGYAVNAVNESNGNQNASVEIDFADIDPDGSYALSTGAGSSGLFTEEFDVAAQSTDLTWDEDSATELDTSVELDFDFDRNIDTLDSSNPETNVTIAVDGPGTMEGEEIAALFDGDSKLDSMGGATGADSVDPANESFIPIDLLESEGVDIDTRDDNPDYDDAIETIHSEGYVTFNLSNFDGDEPTFNANFERLDNNADFPDAGEYEFTVYDSSTGASATDTIEIRESDADGSFNQGSQRVGAGDVANFSVNFDDTDKGYVQIGSEDSDFVDVLYIEQDDTNEPVDVQFNTRTLGTNANLDDVYDVSNDEEFESELHSVSDNSNLTADTNAETDAAVGLYEDDGQNLADFEDYLEAMNLISDGDDRLSQLTRPLQPTDYEITAASGLGEDQVFDADDGGSANNELASKVLELRSPDVGEITLHTAPEEAADDADTADELTSVATPVEEIDANDGEVAQGDRLIVQVEATGLYGAITSNPNVDDGDFSGELNTDFARTSGGASTQFLNNVTESNESVSFSVEAAEGAGNQDPLEVDLTAGDSDTYTVIDNKGGQFFLVADTSSDSAFENGDAPDSDTTFTAELEYDADNGGERMELGGSQDGANGVNDPYSVRNGAGSDYVNYPFLSQGETISNSADLDITPREFNFDNLNENDVVQVEGSAEATVGGTTNVAPNSDAQLRLSSSDASTSFRTGNDINITTDGAVTTTYDLSDQEVGDEFDLDFRIEGSSADTADGIIVESVGEEEPADDGEEEEPADDGEEEEPADDGEEEEPADDGEEDDSTDDGTPGFGAVVALIALIGAALLAVRRQN